MRFDTALRCGGWLCEVGGKYYLRLDGELWGVAWWHAVDETLVRTEEMAGELETAFRQFMDDELQRHSEGGA